MITGLRITDLIELTTTTGSEVIPVVDMNSNQLKQMRLSTLPPAVGTVIDPNYVHTDNNYTTEEKVKLSALGEGGVTADSTTTLTNKTLDSMTNRIGADSLHYKAKNQSGVTIPKGTLIKSVGYESGEEAIRIAPVTSLSDVAFGITKADILTDSYGLVVNTGIIDGINTSAYPTNTIIYNAGNGSFTNIKPSSQYYQSCAVVLRQQANNGSLLVEFTAPQKNTIRNNYISTNNQTQFQVLNATLTDPLVYTNGLLETDTYAVSSNAVTFNAPKTTGAVVVIIQH